MAGVVAARLSPSGSFVAVISGIAAAAALGLVNGVLIARVRIQPFIVTLAMMIAARGAALAATNEQSVSIHVDATALAATGAQRIATTSREQEIAFANLGDRVRKIASISGRNRVGAEEVSTSAREQAAALRELEGATHELRGVAAYLDELTRRITSVG